MSVETINIGMVRDAFASIHKGLTRSEAGAIVDVARLAANADGTVSPAELETVKLVARVCYGLAGLDGEPPVPTGTIDAKRVADISKRLVPQGARELGFAAAMLVAIQDVELAAQEAEFVAALAESLLIDRKRARELSAKVMSALRA